MDCLAGYNILNLIICSHHYRVGPNSNRLYVTFRSPIEVHALCQFPTLSRENSPQLIHIHIPAQKHIYPSPN